MGKSFHEIRCPIHTFIRLDSDELKVLNSRPLQRLRYIHQLATTYLIYPGATHKRFEHSLGVMELAGRVYDVITEPNNIHPTIRNLIPEIDREDAKRYWRRVLRVAALCHDIGHLPFSHAAEELLPSGNHETLTVALIRSPEMKAIWENMTPPLRTGDIVKLAVGPKELRGVTFSDWEAILSEVIVGDAFGVDRMDYLLRDSHHAGVVYGKFDHFRLIDTLRILPREEEGSLEPALGVEEGGLHSAEAMLLARYFMYVQVYFHPIRRVYDIHLKDFLKQWLKNGKYNTDVEKHLQMTDNEVTAAILKAARSEALQGHDSAYEIVNRCHYRVLYQRNPEDIAKNPEAAHAVFDAAVKKFGSDAVRIDSYKQKGNSVGFPVISRDNRISPSITLSETLQRIPVVAIDYVFISPSLRKEAEKWLEQKREDIIKIK